MNLEKYTIEYTSTIFETLAQIEKNKKGFVIVVNEDGEVRGTLTDGDLRRAILNNNEINSSIKTIFCKDYKYINNETDSFNDIIEKFKSERIDFLPIINNKNKLINVITKSQFHAILLGDFTWDFAYDFTEIDNRTVNHEIYNRPWGYYKTVFLSEYTRAKIIHINPGGVLSLQEHKKREEHWVVIKGQGEITIGESIKSVSAGSYVFIPKGCKHRVTNPSEKNPLLISEVQLGTYFGEDDIIRYSDKYGRIK